MALIKCPECGKSVSDTANLCPNCGFNISETENIYELSRKKEQELDEIKQDKYKTIIKGAAIVIIIAIIFGAVYYKSTESERLSAQLQESMDEYNKTTDEINDLQRQLDENQALIDQYENGN